MKTDIQREIDGDDATRRDEEHLGHLAMLGEMGASQECIDDVIARYDAQNALELLHLGQTTGHWAKPYGELMETAGIWVDAD